MLSEESRRLLPSLDSAVSTAARHLRVVASLRLVVADTYALIGQTHICHWNVRGPAFFSLHTASDQHNTEMFAAVDELADRIRSMGALVSREK